MILNFLFIPILYSTTGLEIFAIRVFIVYICKVHNSVNTRIVTDSNTYPQLRYSSDGVNWEGPITLNDKIKYRISIKSYKDHLYFLYITKAGYFKVQRAKVNDLLSNSGFYETLVYKQEIGNPYDMDILENGTLLYCYIQRNLVDESSNLYDQYFVMNEFDLIT